MLFCDIYILLLFIMLYLLNRKMKKNLFGKKFVFSMLLMIKNTKNSNIYTLGMAKTKYIFDNNKNETKQTKEQSESLHRN